MAQGLKFADLEIGTDIPGLSKGPITRTQLALFAGASGDHNPIHLDDAEAQAGGLPGVIVHGMLMMATLGQMLTNWCPQQRLRKFSNRFAAMAVPGDTIMCSGRITAKREEGGERLVDLEIKAENQSGAVLLVGAATVAVD
ncbi:MAG: MaoC family dehydratase N-terminal domain-containing protein [Rhodobacteraceae bacterium]|nr:MaoC family dehydratase N-terminal domain-containing protein [Paracoccaceae bacterium]